MANPTFHIDPAQIHSGSTFRVYVDTSPCNPATVSFSANGVVVDTKNCAVGGSVQFTCPANHTSRPWRVVVECPSGEWAELTGTIN